MLVTHSKSVEASTPISEMNVHCTISFLSNLFCPGFPVKIDELKKERSGKEVAKFAPFSISGELFRREKLTMKMFVYEGFF